MPKYIYPAIFTTEADGCYSVRFPDLVNCFSGGSSLVEAMDMAKDALCLTLYDMEQCGETIPKASSILDVKKELCNNEFPTLIECDTIEQNSNRNCNYTEFENM